MCIQKFSGSFPFNSIFLSYVTWSITVCCKILRILKTTKIISSFWTAINAIKLYYPLSLRVVVVISNIFVNSTFAVNNHFVFYRYLYFPHQFKCNLSFSYKRSHKIKPFFKRRLKVCSTHISSTRYDI